MKYIECGWESYLRMVVPRNASPGQIAETRQAFYAGASVLFHALMMSLDPGTQGTGADMKRMESIQAEIDAFGQALDKKMLKTSEH